MCMTAANPVEGLECGLLINSETNPTAGISLSASDVLPNSVTSGLRLGATGSEAVLFHDELFLNADGSANWSIAVLNPAEIAALDLFVFDNGTSDTYTVSWTHNSLVTALDDVAVTVYRNGVKAASQTVTATDDGVTIVVGSGDGVSDDHYAEAIFESQFLRTIPTVSAI